MTRALFRKQMMEVFSWLYQDKKSEKHRTAKGVIGWALLYLLIFGFLGAMFGFAAAALCEPLLAAGMGWLYWCLMSLIAIFFGVFGSVFNTYSSLYQARDNDLLLSMPIPTRKILLVRLSGVYAMGLMYELIVMIPTALIWFAEAPFSLMGTVHVLLIPLVLSLLILALSALLGWAVAQLAARVKHKNLLTVLISLVFIAAYYYVYASAYSFIQVLLLHLDAVGSALKTALYPLYHMGMAAQGSVGSMLIFTAILAAAAAIPYWILSRSFLKLATDKRGADRSVYKEQAVKFRSVRRALLQKELRRFTGSANYMLNCGLGIVLMPAATICLLTTMNDMAAPSVSLEGKNLWILQSLPVSGRQALTAKLELSLLLTCLPALPLVIVVEWLIQPGLLHGVLIPLVAAAFSALMAELGLALNLKMPNLHWTSEIVPLKQSAPVTVTLFGGWLIVVALAGVYVLLRNAVSVTAYFILLSIALLIAGCALHRWLTTKGAKIFEEL